jgi:hypothetical protein
VSRGIERAGLIPHARGARQGETQAGSDHRGQPRGWNCLWTDRRYSRSTWV